MAKCNMCEKSRPLFATGENGLCSYCDVKYLSILENNVRRLQDSENIIVKSKNIKTIGDRFEFIISLLKELKVYEDKNVPVFDHKIDELITDKAYAVNEILLSALEPRFDIAKEKIIKAKSDGVKEKAITSFFDDADMVKEYLSRQGKNYQDMYDKVGAWEDALKQ